MFELIKEIIYKTTGITGVTQDTDFIKDLALSSFDIMNIICEFEEILDMTIETREVWHMHQVKDVLAYMEKHNIHLPAKYEAPT